MKKISHSSQALTIDNIKGSFNGSDIERKFTGIQNNPQNFEKLYLIHDSIGFEDNLERLVEATNVIVPTGAKYQIDLGKERNIRDSITRAVAFCKSSYYDELFNDLNTKVAKYKDAILLASLIDNVNIRGRAIEYLVTGEDEALKRGLIETLQNKSNGLPRFSTDNSLGDYVRDFVAYHTETDVKTKIMVLDSNPKAYNVDKMLEFLASENSVFMFYFIGLLEDGDPVTSLISMFDSEMIDGTFLLKHWAGRNSRGVTQLEGKMIKRKLWKGVNTISISKADSFISKMIMS